MAREKKTAKKKAKTPPKKQRVTLHDRLVRWFWRIVAVVFLFAVLVVLLGRFFNPPTNIYMFSESRRLGGVTQTWVPMAQIAPAMARSAVAAEDANYCQHW